MNKYYFIFLFSFFLMRGEFYAQSPHYIQELKNQISKSKDDTTKVKKLINLSNNLSNSEFKDAIRYANEALTISSKINYIKGKAGSYNSLADAYWFHSDYEKAQQYYFKAYRISDSINDKKAVAFALYNIGWILCIQQHNYKEDKYLYQSLQIYKQARDTSGLLKIYNALASYYADRFKQEKKNKQYFDSALVYFNKGIEDAELIGANKDLGRIYGNLGELFYQEQNYRIATYYNEKCLEVYQKTTDSSSLIVCILDMGLCEMATNHTNEAILKFNVVSSYNTNHEIKDVQVLTLKSLAEAYYQLKNYKESYDYYQKYMDLKEELDKEAYSTNISNLQSNYNLEKSEANVEQLKQTNEIQELKNKKNTYFIFGLLAIAFIVIIVAFLLFKQNKQKQLINIQLHNQNQIIAEKKQEIDSSIQYAKGIQLAILPHLDELTNQFNQSFVYYKPKDVVSGDFYWFAKVETDFYCIAADCTGHGVPGALMSIIGIEKIVQAIFGKKITEPGNILSFLNIQIKQVLKQHSDKSKQKDGMDLSLIKFNHDHSEVEFSGANRPLIIIRNNALIEYKADKTAIAGFTSDEQLFETTKIPLHKNDMLYMFTDGYADQFGGEVGKKFMTKNLKQILISIAELPANQQQEHIKQAFKYWKKDYEQVDDVLVIGIKV